MEGTAFSIDEASFDASLIPEGSRTPGTEEFQRAVNYLFAGFSCGDGKTAVGGVRRRPDRGGLGACGTGGTSDGHDRPAPTEAPV